LVSVATALEFEGETIKEGHVALRGVAHKPWRDIAVEAVMRGQPANRATFARAADLLPHNARGYAHNTFKIELAHRAIVRTLTQAAQATPQTQSNKKMQWPDMT
jgi:xanthine dehydrogenase YagS FAD-binding subunit